MTDSVPEERSAGGAGRTTSDAAAGTERDPANIAPTVLYLASDEADWITGRCFGVSGYRVTLYTQIEPQVVLQGTEPWTTESLAKRFPQAFGQALGKGRQPGG